MFAAPSPLIVRLSGICVLPCSRGLHSPTAYRALCAGGCTFALKVLTDQLGGFRVSPRKGVSDMTVTKTPQLGVADVAEQTDTASDIGLLESLVFSESPKCESRHQTTAVPSSACSIDATHRVIHCQGSGLICTNLAAADVAYMGRGGLCADCIRPASDCWRIYLV